MRCIKMNRNQIKMWGDCRFPSLTSVSELRLIYNLTCSIMTLISSMLSRWFKPWPADRSLTFLSDEGQRPGEHVHEVGQPVGVRGAVKLPDVHHIILIFQHRSWEQNTHTHINIFYFMMHFLPPVARASRFQRCCHGFPPSLVSPLLLYTSR